MSSKAIRFIEYTILKTLIEELAVRSWALCSYHPQFDTIIELQRFDEFWKAYREIDAHGVLLFEDEDGGRLGVFVVQGNGEDVISDYAVNPDFDEAVKAAQASIETPRY